MFLEAAGTGLVLGPLTQRHPVINWPLSRLMLSKGRPNMWSVTGMLSRPDRGYNVSRHTLRAIQLQAIHSNGYSFQSRMTTSYGGKG